MDNDSSHLSQKILKLTLEIIHLLTGEECTVVKKTSEEAITIPQPISEIQMENFGKNLLQFTAQITQLISGEVPLRCEDVTVYFSMEEWDYVKDHKSLYEDIMMDGDQLSSLGQHNSKKNSDKYEIMSYGHTWEGGKGTQKIQEENLNVPSPTTAILSADLSSDSREPLRSSRDISDSIPRNYELFTPPGPKECGKTFPCSQCGKLFKNKTNLSIHAKIHTDRSLKCSECGKIFIHKRSLLDHQRIRTGEKPFSCAVCGKCFRCKMGLQSHQRTHTGKKLYGCTECGNFFSGQSALNRHQRTHTREKPFLCSDCGGSFARKDYLIYHQKIHTGEKPFTCPYCEKSFTQKSNFIRHRSKCPANKLSLK